MSDRIYRHKKTGKLYVVLNMEVINCTNANDDQIMVAYKNKEFKDLFVREKNEFLERFELTDIDEFLFHYDDEVHKQFIFYIDNHNGEQTMSLDRIKKVLNNLEVNEDEQINELNYWASAQNSLYL